MGGMSRLAVPIHCARRGISIAHRVRLPSGLTCGAPPCSVITRSAHTHTRERHMMLGWEYHATFDHYIAHGGEGRTYTITNVGQFVTCDLDRVRTHEWVAHTKELLRCGRRMLLTY